mgnify:FL=1|jgi:hypothetical protein
MKKLLGLCVSMCVTSYSLAGPIVETFECTLNDGKTMEDVSNMVQVFSDLTKKAGIEDSYVAHVGFQQVPIKTNSVNWIGISPSAVDFGKAIDWFTSTEDGASFAALYQSVYTCENSFMTYITASSSN